MTWVEFRMSDFCRRLDDELWQLVEAACSDIKLYQYTHHVDVYTEGVLVAQVPMNFYPPEHWVFSVPAFPMKPGPNNERDTHACCYP